MTDAVQKPTQKVEGAPGFSFSLSAGNFDRIMNVASPLFLLLLWEVAARLGWIDVRFFPAPS
jgi:ABC-type nitrate/sulfonate/bicarbonate transport system permease component